MATEAKIRIFHAGDVHLDTPFSRLDAERGEARRRDLRSTFTGMMLYARMKNCQLVLLPGDLFDDGFATKETVELLCREFENSPDIRFVIAPGNHDPYRPGSVYAAKKFPENVYIFSSPAVSRFEFPELGADVYGWAFTSSFLTEDPLAGFAPEENGRIRLLCAHGDLTSPVSNSCPLSESDFVRGGFTYAALGHIHKSPGIKRVGRTWFGYSGSPEGRSFDECGERGAYYAEIDEEGEVAVSFVPFSRRIYRKESCDLTGCRTEAEASHRILGLFEREKLGKNVILRLTLTGSCAPGLTVREDELAERVFSLDLRDETSPTFDGALLEQDLTLRGALYRILLPELTSEDPEVRRTAADALRCGLTALDGGVPADL